MSAPLQWIYLHDGTAFARAGDDTYLVHRIGENRWTGSCVRGSLYQLVMADGDRRPVFGNKGEAQDFCEKYYHSCGEKRDEHSFEYGQPGPVRPPVDHDRPACGPDVLPYRVP